MYERERGFVMQRWPVGRHSASLWCHFYSHSCLVCLCVCAYASACVYVCVYHTVYTACDTDYFGVIPT